MSPRVKLFTKEKHALSVALNEAKVALLEGNFEIAEDLAKEILEGARVGRVARLSAELILIQSRSRQGQFTGLLDELGLLIKRVPKSNYRLQAYVANEILRVCFRSGNLGIGAQRGEEMLSKWLEKWQEEDAVEFLCQLSSCHFHRGDTFRAEELMIRALEMAEKSTSAKALTQTFWQLSALSFTRGELSKAIDQSRQAQDWAKSAGLKNILPILRDNAAQIMLELPGSDLDKIRALAEAAYIDLSSQNSVGNAAYPCVTLSEVALRQEDFESSLFYAKKALEELPSEITGPRTSILVQLAKVNARMGNYEEAKTFLQSSTDFMESVEPSRELARQWGDVARIFVEIGLADKGVYAYEKAIQISGLLREEQDIQVK